MTVHVFVRQTKENNKQRPEWFSYEKCFQNLLSIVDDDTKLTVFFDGDPTDHFISNYKDVHVVTTKGGTDSKSLGNLIMHVLKQKDIQDDDIIYFVEDDYMHLPGSIEILREGLNTLSADYLTLYDHADKYMPGYYERYARGFPIQLFHTKSTHWRTTPSTTNTYAMKFKTLKKDIDIHITYTYTDHQKFLILWNKGSSLISPIPGYSTHSEVGLLSPVISWHKV